MKNRFRIITVVICLLSLTSCMTSFKAQENEKVTGQLVGMSQSEIIEYLGAPNDIVSYQNGSILVYEGNEVAFRYNRSRKLANPKLEVYCNGDEYCTSTRVSNMEKVKKFSVGKTIALVLPFALLLGLL